MGFLSDIFAFFKDLFSGIIKFLKDNFLLLVLIGIGIFFFFPGAWAAIIGWLSAAGGWIWAGIAAVGTWLGGFTLGELLLGAAAVWFLSDPEGAIEFIADAIQEVTAAVAGGIVEGLGGSNLLIAGLAGFGLWLWLGKSDDDEEAPISENQRQQEFLATQEEI